MSYRYEFDDTWDGNLRLRRASYEILQDAYRRLCDELEAWNRQALDHGASTQPYEQEVDDLNRMLAWGDEQLARAGASEITVRGISIASSSYAKAALTLAIHRRSSARVRMLCLASSMSVMCVPSLGTHVLVRCHPVPTAVREEMIGGSAAWPDDYVVVKGWSKGTAVLQEAIEGPTTETG